VSIQPPVHVDRTSSVPLYVQVAEQLEHAISTGQLSPGDRIPNEVAMAQALGLSRPTLRQAMQSLVDKGLVVRKRGVGTQVVRSRIRRPLQLTSLYDDLAQAGETPETRVLGLSLTAAQGSDASELRLAIGAPVWSLERLRLVGGQPLALLHNVIPAELIDLEGVDLTDSGLYQQMRRCGTTIRVAHQQMGARRADAREARLLQERKGSPLLVMKRTAYDDSGRAVEVGSHVYRPDLYSFEVTLVDR